MYSSTKQKENEIYQAEPIKTWTKSMDHKYLLLPEFN